MDRLYLTYSGNNSRHIYLLNIPLISGSQTGPSVNYFPSLLSQPPPALPCKPCLYLFPQFSWLWKRELTSANSGKAEIGVPSLLGAVDLLEFWKWKVGTTTIRLPWSTVPNDKMLRVANQASFYSAGGCFWRGSHCRCKGDASVKHLHHLDEGKALLTSCFEEEGNILMSATFEVSAQDAAKRMCSRRHSGSVCH